VVQCCLDLGVNFIDTAIGYLDSEQRIGKAVAGRREKVFIATKTPVRDKETATKHLDASLRRLRTDYIDLWQFHNVANEASYVQIMQAGGAMEAAQGALKAGKIRHIGFSSHSVDMALKMVPLGLFETVMVPLNFVCNEGGDRLVPLAREHDVGFLAMKPFAGGRIRTAWLAIKYLLQFENVVPVPGIEKAEEMEEIVDIVNGSWELMPEEQEAIEDIRARVGTRFCRRCEYCMPCPQGVLIPPLMHLPVLWELWSPERFFSWDYITDGVESQKNCTQCGECEEKCPYHLPIREMIAEHVEFYRKLKQLSH